MGFFKSLFGGSNTPETEKEKNDKKNFEILKYDGIRARHMGKLPYAIKCFEEAAAINDEMETLTLLANAYIQANRLDDARITFNRMAEKEPEQVNTFLSLASICFMQEDYEGMNDACQKALALDDKNPLTYYLTAKAAVGMKEEINAIVFLCKEKLSQQQICLFIKRIERQYLIETFLCLFLFTGCCKDFSFQQQSLFVFGVEVQ